MTFKYKELAYNVVAGMFGGGVLGSFIFINLTNFGGNHGCWAIIDKIFGTAGYESCGSFGALSGVIIGSISFSLLSVYFKPRFSEFVSSILLIALMVLYSFVLSMDYYLGNLAIAFVGIMSFAGVSLIISLIFLLIFNKFKKLY